jgi:hypothetical protein
MGRSLVKWSPSVGGQTAFVTQGIAWGDKTSAKGEDGAPGGVHTDVLRTELAFSQREMVTIRY